VFGECERARQRVSQKSFFSRYLAAVAAFGKAQARPAIVGFKPRQG